MYICICVCIDFLQVFHRTPAYEDGSLCPGDELVSVNDTVLRGMSRKQTADIIQAEKVSPSPSPPPLSLSHSLPPPSSFAALPKLNVHVHILITHVVGSKIIHSGSDHCTHAC